MDSESSPNLLLALYCSDILNHSVSTKAYSLTLSLLHHEIIQFRKRV